MTNPNYLYKNNTLIYKNMRQNIKNNRDKSIKAKLYHGRYYDFALFRGEISKYGKEYIDSLAVADFSSLNIKDNVLYSDATWSKSINDGVKLENIGFTGMDNGLISFRKDRITNEEFLNLYLNSELSIDSGDTRLFLNPITGNTLTYSYPINLEEDKEVKYISCKGGFYQGFFKLPGLKYQVMPNKLDDDWIFHFELRPRTDYELNENIINNDHPDNEGIFFFMGTRAENKFWPYNKINQKLIEEFKKNETNGACVNNCDNIFESWVKEEGGNENNYFAIGDDYFIIDEKVETNINNNTIITCEDYFQDDYFNNKCPEIDNNKFVEDEYILDDIKINLDEYEDSEGHKLTEKPIKEIESDNKFLMFDRTKDGFTTKNWIEGTKVSLINKRDWPNENYFLLMNRTDTGYTVNTIQEYNDKHSYDFNIYKDIRDNVFALRIKNDGSIGYRYGVFNCNSENKYELIEEYSKPGIIIFNEWNNINVRCTKTMNNKMKLMFYVNGFLVFISKEINIFNFKALDEVQEKQETVPYNISIGGGTIGLAETILQNYYAISNYTLPIEKDFCGTFIGDIKSFKMYEGFIDYSSITNYLS